MSIDANASVWSMSRVCALFAISQTEDIYNYNDNKDGIVEKDCYLISSSSSLLLTFSEKSSLIDMLKCNSMEDSRSKRELNISYEEAVGSNANVFICYSNEDNFIDLVNALDDLCSDDPDTFNSADTVIYFELFAIDMWNIQSKKNMYWQIGSTGYMEKYRNFIKKMGHTICFVSDWKQPTYRKSTMSLFEIGQSDMITLFFTGRVAANLRYNIRYDYSSVCRSLCDGIRVENSISHSPFVEKNEIFRYINDDNGGLSGFNERINKCLRDWLTAKTITGNLAMELYNQGKIIQVKYYS